MIYLNRLTKSYLTAQGRHYLFRDLSLELPTGRSIGLLGKNGAGKSTLLRIIGGIDYPDSGEVVSDSTISWPVGLAGGFQGSLTGRQNVRFVSRLYVSEDEVRKKEKFVEDFAEIGKYFDMPVKSYSSGMKSRLTFGLSMAFDFDYYLVDEVAGVGDASFRKKSAELIEEKRRTAGFIVVTHNLKRLQEQCDVAVTLMDGQATYFDDVAEAIKVYESYALAKK
ncbi:MAG: ABC transporter ATP-binding protein [Pseudomonadota bacterium]|nr:ABC transporter ATP-binding protein [Pseudomonadota bacterium]